MKKTSIEKCFKKVAKQNGISVEEVKSEIQSAIEIAMLNPDPAIREQWNQIPHKGETVSPEEIIAYLINKINESR